MSYAVDEKIRAGSVSDRTNIIFFFPSRPRLGMAGTGFIASSASLTENKTRQKINTILILT
jgi:hypothetical protein